MKAPLPIDEILPELVANLRQVPAIVLQAATGAGKTTRVPPAILDAGLAGDRQVLLLQPRRIAARAAAARMAAERGGQLGEEIGYQVRFEQRAGKQTRILSLTDGVFLRFLQDDPFLERASVVLFDEFHERSLNADLALALVRRVQREVRPDLKIVVMSATLAANQVSHYLGDCLTLASEGRLFPVAIEYLRHDVGGPLSAAVASSVYDVLERTRGDVLVFLPGVGEIRQAGRELAPLADERDLDMRELYGDLPLDRQQAVLAPGTRRRIILATNVAETSLTIEGVAGVVDSGLARVQRVDPAFGVNRLHLERISKASAAQRAGRAGRLEPGVCLRLWTERDQQSRPEHDTPEVARVDLAGAVLELLCAGEPNVGEFPWFEPPSREALSAATSLLELLGAAERGRATKIGKRVVRLPVHPRIGRLLLEAERLGAAERAALTAALLSERDVFRGGDSRARTSRGRWSDSDVLDRLAAIEGLETRHRGSENPLGSSLNRDAARFALRSRDQLLRMLDRSSTQAEPAVSSDEAIQRALLVAFPDRVARRRAEGGARGVMVGGRGVRLADQSAVREAELFVCVEVEEIGQSELLVRQASAIRREWLPESQLSTTIDIEYDADRERVVGMKRTRYADLILDEAPTSLPPEADASAILAREAEVRLELLAQADEATAAFLARVGSLREWMPELEFPQFDQEALRALLPRLCQGCRSLDEVRRAPWLHVLQSALTPAQLLALERHAPERLQVPTGSRIALVYEAGCPPILPVRIQEVFGLRETPRVAAGRVPVLLHLLGPNYRVQQVTNDLASFWANTYPQVRKDLRRRYPKHSWPEDGATAPPQKKG